MQEGMKTAMPAIRPGPGMRYSAVCPICGSRTISDETVAAMQDGREFTCSNRCALPQLNCSGRRPLAVLELREETRTGAVEHVIDHHRIQPQLRVQA